MARLAVILPVIAVALDIFSIIDIIRIEEHRVRGLPKFLWVAIVVLLPFIGVILWFTIGRARGDSGGQRRTLAPDDDPNFLRNLRRDEEAEERIRRLEQELAELDDDPPKD